MKITVKLFATLRRGRFKVEEREYPENTTVASIVSLLEIPHQELGIVFVNGKHAELDRVLRPGDVLAIFPPVGGG